MNQPLDSALSDVRQDAAVQEVSAQTPLHRRSIEQLALSAVRLSIASCLVTFIILVSWIVARCVNGLHEQRVHPLQTLLLSAWVALICLALWIGAALVGIVAGLLSRSERGTDAFCRSLGLLSLLFLIPILLLIMPKT